MNRIQQHNNSVQLNRLIGVKFAPRLPVWLARAAQYLLWRYFGSSVHPSWVDNFQVDAIMSNARLRSTGWAPRYTSKAAVRSGVSKPFKDHLIERQLSIDFQI